MELTISKQSLNDLLAITQNFVAKKTTMPILNNILISASEGKLQISATDLEVTAVASNAAQVKRGGSTTVNAKVFNDIVKELPDGDVTIKLQEGERVEIIAQNSKLRMNGVSSDEFPSLPGMNFKPSGKISSAVLSEMIGKTLYSVSQDETRFNLNGVCFELNSAGKGKKDEKVLRLVATDGHRLGMINRPISGLSFDERIIVPRKGLSEIKRIIDGEDTEIGIEVKEGFMVIEAPRAKISVHLIDGAFPDYNQVIPKGKGTEVVLNSKEFSHTLRRVALMVTDKSKLVRFDLSDNRLRVSGSSPELGDATEELEVKYKGEQLSIGFNAQYCIDFISTMSESGNLIIELNGALGPGKFTPEGDESCIGVIMPMRL